MKFINVELMNFINDKTKTINKKVIYLCLR